MKRSELKLRGRKKEAFEFLIDFKGYDNFACPVCKKNWVSVKKGTTPSLAFITCCNQTMEELKDE